jgi:hypothetical protein
VATTYEDAWGQGFESPLRAIRQSKGDCHGCTEPEVLDKRIEILVAVEQCQSLRGDVEAMHTSKVHLFAGNAAP